MKTLKEYIFEQLIVEKFESSIIKEFIKKIENILSEDAKTTWSSNKFYLTCYGRIDGKSIYNCIDMSKEWMRDDIRSFSKKMALSDFKDKWIKDFNGKHILEEAEIEKLVGDCHRILMYKGLDDWAEENSTIIILFHKIDETLKYIGTPLAAICINPEKRNEVITYWDKISKKREERKENNDFEKLKNKENNTERRELTNNALKTYLDNSSKEQNKFIKEIITYFTSGAGSIDYWGGENKEKNPSVTLKDKLLLRDQVIRWLLLIDEQHPKPTSKYRFTHCKKDQQDSLIEFWEDLKKRFTIDDFKLIPKK